MEARPRRASPEIEPAHPLLKLLLRLAPIWRDASWPSLNSIRVGIDMIPYFAAVRVVVDIVLTIFTLP